MAEAHWAQILARAIEKESTSSAPKTSDFWQKLSIAASIFSSVVIASVGLMMQRWQAQSTEALSRAQLEVTRSKNIDEVRIEEGRLANDLLKQLLESNGKHRTAILVMLEPYMPKDRYVNLCNTLARDDAEEPVRLAAIRQLAQTNSGTGLNTLTSIAVDAARSPQERTLAQQSAEEVKKKRIETFEAVKALANPSSTLKISARISGDCKETSAYKYDCIEGQRSKIMISNEGNQSIFLYLLDLGPDKSIKSFNDSLTQLRPNETTALADVFWSAPLGADIIKIIATQQAFDVQGIIAATAKPPNPSPQNDWTTLNIEVSVRGR